MSEPQPQPAPSPYYPPLPPPPHSHDKYVGTIIGVAVIVLILGAAIGYGLGVGITTQRLGTSPQQRQVTYVHGTASHYCSSFSICFLEAIWFANQDRPDLAFPLAGEASFGYQLYLESGIPYQVTIGWTDYTSTSTEYRECQGHPQPFTPTGTRYTQNFSC